jgi:hypothetical protein
MTPTPLPVRQHTPVPPRLPDQPWAGMTTRPPIPSARRVSTPPTVPSGLRFTPPRIPARTWANVPPPAEPIPAPPPSPDLDSLRGLRVTEQQVQPAATSEYFALPNRTFPVTIPMPAFPDLPAPEDVLAPTPGSMLWRRLSRLGVLPKAIAAAALILLLGTWFWTQWQSRGVSSNDAVAAPGTRAASSGEADDSAAGSPQPSMTGQAPPVANMDPGGPPAEPTPPASPKPIPAQGLLRTPTAEAVDPDPMAPAADRPAPPSRTGGKAGPPRRPRFGRLTKPRVRTSERLDRSERPMIGKRPRPASKRVVTPAGIEKW